LFDRKNSVVVTAVLFLALCFCFGFLPQDASAEDYPRLFGDTRYQTSAAVAEKYNNGQVDNVIIASGVKFPDALSVSTLAGQLHAPILLVNKTADQSQDALDYISKHMTGGKVWIIGGTNAVDGGFESKLTSMGNSVERLAGYDRYETCSAIVEKTSVPTVTPVFVASGENFPDALSIASVAAAKGYPIILTPKNALPDGAESYLSNQQPSEVFIIGGTGVIPQAIESRIRAILPSATVTRLAGRSRYDTSVEVYKKFFDDPKNIYIASGTNFADALSTSVLAAKNNAPVVLIDSRKKIPPESTMSYLERLGAVGERSFDPLTFPPADYGLYKKQPNITLVGGPAAISGVLIRNINDLTRMPLGVGRGYLQNYETAPPETSGYPIPERYHFFEVEGSVKPSDPDYAELSISLDIENNFEKQLQELRSIIQPVLGSNITEEIIACMREKTNCDVLIGKWWETNSKTINVASGYRDFTIEFMSWRKSQ